MIKKARTRGGYSPTRELQNTNPQWVVAPVKKKYYFIQDMQCTHTVTLWRFRVTTVAVETHILHSVCVFELHGTVNYTEILSVAQ